MKKIFLAIALLLSGGVCFAQGTGTGGGQGGSGGGGGAVNSVSGDGVLFSNSGSTGAVTLTPASAAQNSVYAGPASGGAAAPSFQTAPTFSGANLTSLPLCSTCAPLASPTFTGTVTIPTAAVTTMSGAANFSGTPTFAAGAGLGTGTFSGGAIFSGNDSFTGTPAASSPGLQFNNTTCFNGGSTTTNTPSVYINQSATPPTTWSANCTVFGINAPSGALGTIFEIHLNGGSGIWRVTSSGATQSTGYSLISGHVMLSNTAPTIASGFGSTPSIVASNGTAAFTVNVGTGGAASSGVLTMPTATTGWSCQVFPNGAPQAGAVTYSAPTSATTVTLTNYTESTGVALAWTASLVLNVNCIAY